MQTGVSIRQDHEPPRGTKSTSADFFASIAPFCGHIPLRQIVVHPAAFLVHSACSKKACYAAVFRFPAGSVGGRSTLRAGDYFRHQRIEPSKEGSEGLVLRRWPDQGHARWRK